MTEILSVSYAATVLGALVLYALAFIAGGIYYLEQRVARIRDQFPRRGLLSRLVGYTALAIGLLMAVSIGGHVITANDNFRLGALVAVVSGIAFWVHHMLIDLTPGERIRDALLSLICAGLAMVTRWWIQTL
jgi:uncharacterized membrane-anchored protein